MKRRLRRLLPSACCLVMAGCIALSDAGTEGKKCFDDGACIEGLVCTGGKCSKATGTGDPCAGKNEGDGCPNGDGSKGACAVHEGDLICAALCPAPGKPCGQGACYAAWKSVFLCSKPGQKALAAPCGAWDQCEPGLQCMDSGGESFCFQLCSDAAPCPKGTCDQSPMGYTYCPQFPD